MSRIPVAKISTVEDRSLPVFSELDDVIERIRDRAFSLFADRGFSRGMDLDDWFRAEREICWPAAEFTENEKEFVLKVELAGFDPDDISVTANPRELIVKAEHEFERREPESDRHETIRWSEFRSDDVFRRVELPAEIDVEKVSAEFKRGLLTVEARKAPSEKKASHKIDISSAA